MIKDKNWKGSYLGEIHYTPLNRKEFSILRPPTTKRYLKAKDKLDKIEQEEIDKRWNLWHYWFKRFLIYHVLRRFFRLT